MTMHRIGADVTVLHDYLEVPGIGFLNVNAFVLSGREPVVIDTGLGLPDRDFVATLGSVIDPTDVRWIWLTHPDRDHHGGSVSPPRGRAEGTGGHHLHRPRHSSDRSGDFY